MNAGLFKQNKAPVAWRTIAVLCMIKMSVHLALSTRYGYHSDELYFIECGKHLAFGYVDHAPMIPWLARLAGTLFGYGLASLRLLPILAGTLTIALSAFVARELSGGAYAQRIAGLCALIAPAYLVTSGMLNIPVFEPLYWTLASLLILRIIQTNQPKLWLSVGIIAGLGLLNKHTMLLWGLGIAVGLLLTKNRRQLATPWPWLGGAIALLIFSPNLYWQYQNNWPTLEFIQNIDKGMLGQIPRVLFLLGQLLYMHPLTAPIWVLGIIFFFSRPGREYRIFGWLYVVVLGVLIIRHGKPYYLAPVYPMLFAGGAIFLEQWTSHPMRQRLRAVLLSALSIGGITLAPLALPALPLPTTERVIGALFGSIVPPTELTGDMHLQHGWQHYTVTFAKVYDGLSEEEKAQTAILTKKYSIASAINFYGPDYELPRAYSGHMTYYFWGPPSQEKTTLLTCGFEREILEMQFAEVEEVATLFHPLGDADFNGLPIYLCRTPRQPIHEIWHVFRRFYHVDLKETELSPLIQKHNKEAE